MLVEIISGLRVYCWYSVNYVSCLFSASDCTMFSGLLRSCKRLMNATTWRPNMNQNMTQFPEMSAPLGWQKYDNLKGFENSSEDCVRSAVYIGFNGFKWLLSSGHQHWYPCLRSSMVLSELVAATPICYTELIPKLKKPYINTRWWSLSMFRIKLDTLKEICTTVVGTTLLHTSSLNCPCAAFLCEGLYRSLWPHVSLIEPRGGRQKNQTHYKKHIWIWKPQKKRLAIVGAVWYCWCPRQNSMTFGAVSQTLWGFRLRIWRHGGSVWSLSDLVAEGFPFWCQHA